MTEKYLTVLHYCLRTPPISTTGKIVKGRRKGIEGSYLVVRVVIVVGGYHIKMVEFRCSIRVPVIHSWVMTETYTRVKNFPKLSKELSEG